MYLGVMAMWLHFNNYLPSRRLLDLIRRWGVEAVDDAVWFALVRTNVSGVGAVEVRSTAGNGGRMQLSSGGFHLIIAHSPVYTAYMALTVPR